MSDRIRHLRRIATRFAIVLRRKLSAYLLAPPPPPPAPLPVSPERGDLRGRVVAVTGSSRGIGLAVARAFARAGAHVVLSGRDASALADAARSVERETPGCKVVTAVADVSTPEGAAALVRSAVSQLGALDVLVNNAAVTGPLGRKTWDLSPAELGAVLAGNVAGPWLCISEAVGEARRARRPLRIVNVSSGIFGTSAPGLGAYAITKWALEGLGAAVATDAASEEVPITVVTLRPPSVRTEMTKAYYPWEEYVQLDPPDVLGDAFVWAATAPAGEVQGRAFLEPALRADPQAEIVLHSSYSAYPFFRIEPAHRRRDAATLALPRDGAYMHLLENPWGAPPAAVAALESALRQDEVARYPDPEYTDLRLALAERHGLAPEHFAFGPGSSEILERILRTFASRRSPVVTTRPTWSLVHVFAARLGLALHEVPYLGSLEAGDLRHDWEGLLRAIGPETSLVYLVNPCNPTGSVVPPGELEELVRRLPAHVTLVLDEAYVDFCDPALRFDLAPRLDRAAARVVGLRTFSKFFGLSGFRIGYAYARPEVARLVERSQIPFAVSHASQVAAVAALGDRAFQQRVYEANVTERARVSRRLQEFGIPHLPSQTHFVLFDAPLAHERLRDLCRERGIFLPVVDLYTRNYGVLPVGRPEHDDVVLEILGRH